MQSTSLATDETQKTYLVPRSQRSTDEPPNRLSSLAQHPSFTSALQARVQDAPRSPVRIRFPSVEVQAPSAATIEGKIQPSPGRADIGGVRGNGTATRPTLGDRHQSIRMVSAEGEIPEADRTTASSPKFQSEQQYLREIPANISLPTSSPRAQQISTSPLGPTKNLSNIDMPVVQMGSLRLSEPNVKIPSQLQHYHNSIKEPISRHMPNLSQSTVGTCQTRSSDQTTSSASSHSSHVGFPRKHISIQEPSPVIGAGHEGRGRSISPQHPGSDKSLSPARLRRNLSGGQSPEARPMSYVDLLNMPYSQQVAQQNLAFDNAKLRGAVGSHAALLDTMKTVEMYRSNVKKTNDLAVQYEFAVFMVNAAQDPTVLLPEERTSALKPDGSGRHTPDTKDEMLKEARQILQRLADKSYVFAQYYLGDGYASGVFNKGKEDYDRAFQLFVSAGKHGHAEAGYRAALCYEFGWGCRKDPAKAVPFYRQSATKNHPGAAVRLGRACLAGDMGLGGKYREGIKWLKRASESADAQHNSGPYELGLLHLTGYADELFKDEEYAAQLFTRAAELGHAEASLRMGEAYEHGFLHCPKDPALSIHFYTGAANAGLPEAMMALCAWYMVGAPPLLPKDEMEAYEWAKQAATTGFPKAEYAVGYFTEMGIGCRRDTLEANAWYVRAAEHGDTRAVQRLAIIRSAEAGDPQGETFKNGREVRKKKSFFDWKGRGK